MSDVGGFFLFMIFILGAIWLFAFQVRSCGQQEADIVLKREQICFGSTKNADCFSELKHKIQRESP